MDAWMLRGRQADTCFPCFAPAPEGGLQRQLYRGCSLGVIHLDLVDWNLDRLAECVFVGALLAIVIAMLCQGRTIAT